MIYRFRFLLLGTLVLSSATALSAQEYVVGQPAFHIEHAQENCQSIGRTLAGFDDSDDIDTMIDLCHNTQSTNLFFCFTRYKVNETQDGHVSILDGTPMPDASSYWEGPPSYPEGHNVMLRTHTFFFIEIINVGFPICQWSEPPMFADGFETGDTSRWSSSVP